MATTVDQVSSRVAPLWREPAIGAPRRQLQPLPDVVVRSRAPGSAASERVLQQRTMVTGLAAYLRQKEIYQRWTAAADAKPVRSVPLSDWARDEATARSKGTYLDARM